MARKPDAAAIEALPHPREAGDLVGHGDVERMLAGAWHSGRLAHAWLFGGPPGVGKTTLAYRFARFVLAAGAGGPEVPTTPTTLAVPETAPVFRQVAAGSHPDLLGIERPVDPKLGRRTGDLPVDQVRRIAPFLRLTASGGGWRVVVVDEADHMNRSSANAILKILEEPPQRSVLVLVTDQPGSLLPTIRSRCRRLMLSPLAQADVEAFLAARLADQGTDELSVAARLSGGAPGRALLMAASGAPAVYAGLLDCVGQAPDLDWTAVHALGDQVGGPGAEALFRQVGDLMVGIMERLVRLAATGQVARPVIPGEEARLRALAASGDLDHWLQVWENTRRLFRRADQANLDRKQALLSAFGQLQAVI